MLLVIVVPGMYVVRGTAYKTMGWQSEHHGRESRVYKYLGLSFPYCLNCRTMAQDWVAKWARVLFKLSLKRIGFQDSFVKIQRVSFTIGHGKSTGVLVSTTQRAAPTSPPSDFLKQRQ